MDQPKSHSSKLYYSVLGLSSDASASAIRAAYKKLAMKWHPDKCNATDRGVAKLKFQEIQEAYAVLSDEKRKMLYDSGLYNPEDDDEDIEGFSSFLDEMSGMMADVQASEEAGKGSSFEELQQLFVSMFSADLAAFNNQCPPSAASSINFDRKRGWGGGDYETTSYFGSCIMDQSLPLPPQTHLFFNDAFHHGSNVNTSAPKKTKCGKVSTTGLRSSTCGNGFNKGNELHMKAFDNGFDRKGS
eukprot:c21513_g1_i1 orf=711-1439(+)